jgi:hypothetical protein
MSKHTTMMGKPFDMEKLYRQHETARAVGNANMNARGDQLSTNGQVVRKREEVVAEYYDTNPLANRKQKTLAKEEPPAVVPADTAPTVVPSKQTKKASE